MIRIASAGLALVAGLVVSTSSASAQVPVENGSVAHAKVTEDDSRFNCLTMGNHRCGPIWAQGAGNHIDCTALEAICLANLEAGATWTSISGPIDGHAPCAQLLGGTTLYACADGYLVSS
jgi:hypothetical protein